MNIEQTMTQFESYTKQFNIEDEGIKRKKFHSKRVMELSKKIAEKLALEKEEIELAMVIGLLHDVGRFPQQQTYQSMDDCKNIDHGDLGANILQQNDMFSAYYSEEEQDIIVKAVKNHNKYAIEKGLNEKEILFAKIIRDADKIDILYESIGMFYIGKERILEEQFISDKIVKYFLEQAPINRKENQEINLLEEAIGRITFIFDLQFSISAEIIQKEDYINKILDRFHYQKEETKEKIEKIRKSANQYIEQKIKKEV